MKKMVAFRLDEGVITAVEEYRKSIEAQSVGLDVSTAAAVRALLVQALAAHGLDAGEED